MAYKFEEVDDYTGGFKDRSHWERQSESRWAHGAIENIEGFLQGVDWGSFNPDTSNFASKDEIQMLKDWNDDRIEEISGVGGINQRTDENFQAIDALTKKFEAFKNPETTAVNVSDITDLDSTIQNLIGKYAPKAPDVSGFLTKEDLPDAPDLSKFITGEGLSDFGYQDAEGVKGSIDTYFDEKGVNDYMSDDSFQSRMTNNLESLSSSLQDEWGIDSLDLQNVLKSVTDEGGDLKKLTDRFAGLDADTSWVDFLGLNDLGQADVEGIISSQVGGKLDTLMGEGEGSIQADRAAALKTLEKTIGQDRLADIRDFIETDLGVDEDGSPQTIKSAIEKLGFNLRQEQSSDVSDLTKAYQGEIATAKEGIDKELLGLTGRTTGLETSLGKTGEQLTALSQNFGDFRDTARQNLTTVQQDVKDFEAQRAKDVLGLTEDIGDVYTSRADALGKLDTTWSDKLRQQEEDLSTQFKTSEDALNQRLSKISSSMNYRTLDDSAEGVKIRRSKAYNQGRTRSGTGQLGRSMKISTLNI